MRSFYQLAVLALPLFSAVAAEPKEVDHPKTIYASAQEAFQDLLNALPEESLQAALSGLKGFKSGIFESHHRGVEHVHHTNPELATRLIVDAVNDLKKRQTPSNGTVTVTEAPPSPGTTEASSPAPQTSEDTSPLPAESRAPAPAPAETSDAAPATETVTQTQQSQQPEEPAEPTTVNAPPETVTETQQRTTTEQRPAIIPVEATVTEEGTTIVRTTQVLSQVTASVPVTLVRTNSVGSTVTETENRPAVIKTTTDGAGRTTVTTSAADYAPTAGQVQTDTDEAGSTFLTTYTPGGGLVSSIKLVTTTDAEGRQSTMTTYEFVDPVQATPTAEGGDSGTDASADGPSLQTGAAAVVLGGAQYAAIGLGAMAFFF